MEKVGDSQSSSEPVVPTSNEMMMKRQQKRVLIVEAESSEICLEKIKGVLEKLRERGDIDTWSEETDGMVMVSGYFDAEKLRMELENEAGDAIKSITDPEDTVALQSGGEVPYSAKIPKMRIPKLFHRRTEVLYHGEKPMEHSSNSQWWNWSSGIMANNLERGDARGSEFPEIPTAEVFDNPKVIFNRSEKTMESSKTQCSMQ